MATTSRLDRRLRTLCSEDEADRASKARNEQEAMRIATERARLDARDARVHARLAKADKRLAKRSVIRSKLENHAAIKAQLRSDIRQLGEDIKKKSETCGDLSDDSLLKEFYENTRPLIEALQSQQADKYKCLHDLVSREPALLDEIDAEDIYLPESTPSEDGNDQAGPGEHGAPHDNRPDSVPEPSADASSHPLRTSSGRPTKKRRISQPKEGPRKTPRCEEERTIDIHDFFQNGKSKHKIFRVNGDEKNWWILWCKEHGMTFNTKQPLIGAGRHIFTDQHGFANKSNEMALGLLGYKVLNCTPQLAEQNNRALETDQETREPHLPSRSGRRSMVSGGDDAEADFIPKSHIKRPTQRRADTAPQPVPDPKPGQIYLAWISQNMMAAICLPLPPSVEGSGIAELQAHTEDLKREMETDPPECYEKRHGAFVWAKDYMDNGPKVDERQHPVVLVNNDNTKKWTRAWIPAVDLHEVEETDPTLQSVSSRNAVVRELQRRKGVERDESGPATRMHRAASVAPGSDFQSPAASRGIPANDQPRSPPVAEADQGQDQVSPSGADDGEKTSHGKKANGSIQATTASRPNHGVTTQGTTELSTARAQQTPDQCRGTRDSFLSVTMGAKIETESIHNEAQGAGMQDGNGMASGITGPTCSEAASGEDERITPTSKASMEVRELFNHPPVLLSHSDVAQDFLRNIARDSLPASGRELGHQTPGRVSAIGDGSVASTNLRYGCDRYASNWPIPMGGERHTHHQMANPAAAAAAAARPDYLMTMDVPVSVRNGGQEGSYPHGRVEFHTFDNFRGSHAAGNRRPPDGRK